MQNILGERSTFVVMLAAFAGGFLAAYVLISCDAFAPNEGCSNLRPVDRSESAASHSVQDEFIETHYPASPDFTTRRPAYTTAKAQYVFDQTPLPPLLTGSEPARTTSVNTALESLHLNRVTSPPDDVWERPRSSTGLIEGAFQWRHYNRFASLIVGSVPCKSSASGQCIRMVEITIPRELDSYFTSRDGDYNNYLYPCLDHSSIAPIPSSKDMSDNVPSGLSARISSDRPSQQSGPQFQSEIVYSVVRRRQTGIQNCYARILANNDKAEGKFKVDFTIGKKGRITDLEVLSDIDGGSISECASNALRRWHFPSPKKPVRFRQSFELSAGD
jgi:hypothetical protein